MKFVKYVGLSMCLLALSACSAKQTDMKSSNESKPIKQQTTASVENNEISNPKENLTDSAEKAKSEVTMDKGIQFNGSYYYVKGSDGQEIPIVNKHYPLSASYNPGENMIAKTAFLELLAGMREAGFSVSDSYSGFRSYDTQTNLYQNYVARDGQAAADRYSARPGHSEHQSGLAFDIIDGSGNLLQEASASQWLLKHAGDYGFVVRYLEGKEDITGYQHEEWHVRYLGTDAKAIAESGKTLEEYYGFTGGDYAE